MRGSKGFSPLNRPQISLCDEKQICYKVNLTLKLKKQKDFHFDSCTKSSERSLYIRVFLRYRFDCFHSLIQIKKIKTRLTNARRRRAEERGILKGERIAKNSAERSLFNHQPSRRVLKHLSPLSGVSLVRFLPTRARNEHPPRFFGSFLADEGKK